MSKLAISHPQPNPLTDDTGAKAIEVATMLGTSVVDVKHCIDPHAGKVSSKTWGLLAAGSACVLLSAIAFTVSIRTAADNKAAFDHWTQVAKKPPAAFRAEQLSFGYDWVAFGGLALGIAALTGGLSRVRRERRSPFYKIGTAPDVHQPVVGAPTESFPLVAPHGDDFVLNFAAGITGDMTVDGNTRPFAELAATGVARPSTTLPGAFELPIPMHGRIRAHIGQTQFVIAGVPKPREQAAPLVASLESRTMTYFAGSLAAHLGLILLLSQVAVEGGNAAIDLGNTEVVDTSGDSAMREDVPPEQEELEDGEGGGEGAAAQKMALAEGAAGTTESTRISGRMENERKTDNPQVARQQAVDAARVAGFLGSAPLQSGDFFSSLTAEGDFSSGFDTRNVYGPIIGAAGEGYGTFGYGRTGFGGGGGCTDHASNCGGIIGTGAGYGKLGLGKYGRDGYMGPGGGKVGWKKRSGTVPPPRIGEAKQSGTYDKALIRRYIKRNISKVAYCYEKQLLAQPTLEGTVTVSFFITPNGTVTGSTGKGVDPEVANCVADVVGAIEFPKPPEGGGVQVNYPFIFHPAGA